MRGHPPGGERSASASTTRLEILQALASGEVSISRLSRRIGVHKSTIQYHRDSLLETGALDRRASPFEHLYCPGPAFAAETAKMGGAEKRPPGVVASAPRRGRFTTVTRAPVSAPVLKAPADPSKEPGHVETLRVGKNRKQVNHQFEFTDSDGYTWPIRFYPRKDGTGTLQIVSPQRKRIPLAKVPGGIVGWQDYAGKILHTWVAGTGFVVSRAREALQQKAILEAEVAQTSIEGSATSAGGTVQMNTTPKRGMIEVTAQEVVDAVEVLPITQRAQDEALLAHAARLNLQEARQAATDDRLNVLAKKHEDEARRTADTMAHLLGASTHHGRALVTVAEALSNGPQQVPAVAAAVASPSPTPLPPNYTGVEYA